VDQLFDGRKDIGAPLAVEVAVIAFATFIVEPYDPSSITPEIQSVLE
jgi:hypothetical protein